MTMLRWIVVTFAAVLPFASAAPVEYPRVPEGRLLLQTLRSHDQYNTTIYGLDDRYRGTRAVWEACHTHGVKRAVFVGRHTYYGTAHDAPLYHGEDDPPMMSPPT